MNKDLERKSRHLSKILRHDSEGLLMDDKGWISVKDILAHLKISKPNLEQIVEENDKKRFMFDNFKDKIRASQGHSKGIATNKEFAEIHMMQKTIKLYHGTDKATALLILKDKIKSGERNHVHWTSNRELALKRANQRYAKTKSEAVFITLDAKAYIEKGNILYLSENEVYLTEEIPGEFLDIEYIY